MAGERNAVAIPGHGMLSSPKAAAIIAYVFERYSRLDGVPLTPGTAQGQIYAEAKAAAMPPDAPDPAEAGAAERDEISTKEAADLLALSERQIRRLVESKRFGRTRKVRGSIRIPAAAVHAVAATRQ